MAKAFSMSIGLPEARKEDDKPAELTGNYPQVLVLSALIHKGPAVEWRPIAAGLNDADLDRAAGEWMEKFKDIWGGKMRKHTVPFVIEAD